MAELDARSAELVREQRHWQPDVTIGAFYEHDSDVDNQGLSLGVDLPVWNRNQGVIAMADAERRKAQALIRAEQQRITRDVDLAWQIYDSHRLNLGPMLKDTQIAAEATVATKLAAFSAGEAELLDVLEARRAAQEVEKTALAARITAAEAWLSLAQAMGTFTASIAPTGDTP
jgi:outer membrane protein TolC